MVILHLLTGTILGTLAGLGIGGGTLLVLWLTLVIGMTQQQARILNLMFFIPCAIICTLIRKKQGAVNIRLLLPGMISGVLAAIVFSLVGRVLDLAILKKLFGGLLILTGIRELLYKPKS